MTHIAVDLDDVVLDFCGGVRKAIETEYGVTLPEFEEWDLHKSLDPIIGYSWWKWMKQRDWLWPNFPVIPGAIGALDQLRREGHYIECVTSKPEWAEASVWKWLGKWRPPFQRVTIVDRQPKWTVTDATLLVDDKSQNCKEFVAAGRRAVLFTREHNRSYQNLADGVLRAYSWSDVQDYVNVGVVV